MDLELLDELLAKKGYTIERKDLDRPWGGFWAIDNSCVPQFIKEFFPSFDQMEMKQEQLSPKILFIKKGSRLSWQYHHRRAEVWQVVDGEVGVVRSTNDAENEMTLFSAGELVVIQQGERHRLIGLEESAVVAEIWIHTNPDDPSDEDDIVRVQDDFGRNEGGRRTSLVLGGRSSTLKNVR